MRNFFVYLLLFFFNLTISAQQTFPVNGVSEKFDPFYAFTNANIILNPNLEISNGVLIIQGNKIIAVGQDVIIPEEAIVHDLDGDYIYPSFIDLYSEYGISNKEKITSQKYRPQYTSNKKGAFHWNQAIHPEVQAHDFFNSYEYDYTKYLENGFGLVVSHVQDGLIRGTGVLSMISSKTDHQNILISKAANFFSFKKGSSKQKSPTSLMGSISLIKQAFLDAEWYKNQEDQTNLSFDYFNKNIQLPNIFIINHELDYGRVHKIADDFEIDFIIKGNGHEYSQIKALQAANLPVIIPLNFPKAYDVSDPYQAEWVSLSEMKKWELAPFNASILEQNNIKFCITSSDLEKDVFFSNLRKAIHKGLSKNTALSALTTIPAEILDLKDKVGSLDEGMLANFFIASKDIFENGKIYEHWTNGKQHIITKKPIEDILGHYSIITPNFKNKKVIIKGKLFKPKVIIYDLDSTSLKTNIKENNIIIHDNKGKFRANLKYHENIISGKYQDSLGDYHNFIARKDSAILSEQKSFNLEIDSVSPQIWFPNKAYGFKKIPNYENIIFRNATVWTNEKEGILTRTDVAIQNGKILAIGQQLDVLTIFPGKNKITQIDASKKHLTCGIVDEHSHIAISKGVNESSQAVTAEVSIGDVINPSDRNIYRQLAGGVTTSQLLHGSANPIGGQSAIVKLRWGSNAEEMKINDASGFIKFALGENVKQSNWGDLERVRFPQTRMGVEQVFYDAFYRAKKYKTSWEEYNNLSFSEKKKIYPPREDLELNALVEILDNERFITCHSYMQSEINMLMHVADSMDFTVNTFTHILEGYKVAEKMKKHGAGGSTFSDWWAYKFEVNDAIPYNATLLNEAGVLTAINSDDAEMGRRLNQEAAKAVKYGNTSEENAWKMVTLNPAKLLHLDDRIGSIKIGKDADLVLWTNNPLSIYAKVIQTYVDGKLLYDINNDKLLRDRDKLERMRIIQKMINSNGEKKAPKKTEEVLYHCDTEYDE